MELTEQINAVGGRVVCELKVYGDNDFLLSTKQFVINVSNSVMSTKILSSNEFTALINALKEINNIDKKFAEVSSQMDEKAKLINARMDTFTKLEEGSTTGDAELKDIRIGANGTTYENAGNAVREQINEVNTSLDKVVTFGKNLFNKKTAIVGYTLDDNGDLTNDDTVVTNAPQYLTSEFISCSNYTGMYFFIAPANGSVCFYNDDKTFISKINNILYSHNRKIPSGAKYLRFTTSKNCLNTTTARISLIQPTESPTYDEYGVKINDNVIIPVDYKLDKNQGTDNAEKYLKVDSDGNVIPSIPPVDDRLYVGTKTKNSGTQDGDQTISIGMGACKDEKCGIIAIGVNAGAKTESVDNSDNGHYSIAIGHRALSKNITGDHNTAIGWGAMADNIDGDGNTAVGEDALLHCTEGNNNVAIGNRAMQTGTGNKNTAIGSTTMYYGEGIPTGDGNTAIGYGAGQTNGSGSYNVEIGYWAKAGKDLTNCIVIGQNTVSTKSNQVIIGNKNIEENVFHGSLNLFDANGQQYKIYVGTDGVLKVEAIS